MKTLRGKLPQGAFPMGYVKIGRLLVCEICKKWRSIESAVLWELFLY